MNDMTVCGNHEALVSYLYDECDGAQREAIAAHLARCASCAEEIGALGDTRAHLASWTPPALPLGFQITRTDVETPGKVLRPAAFWQKPLPAWAQVAAAALIFSAGMSVSSLRTAPAAPVASPADVPAVAASVVSRNDLARLEARLRSIEAAPRTASVQVPRTAGGAIDEPELLKLVNALVDARLSQNGERQIRYMERLAHGLNNEATERVSQVEEELAEQRHVIRTIAGSPFVSVALSSDVR